MNTLLGLLGQLNTCLGQICAVESKLYATGVKALFMKHDYAHYGRSLSMAQSDLVNIANQIQADTSNFFLLKNTALEYISALHASTSKLIALNDALAEKARGNRYNLSEYMADYHEFQRYQNEYLSLGQKLNELYFACRDLEDS